MKAGARHTDAGGVTVEWRAVRDVRVGDEIAGGWGTAIVSAVERSPYGTVRVEYEHGSVVEFRADETFPVLLAGSNIGNRPEGD